MYEYRSYVDGNTIYVEIKYNGVIIDTRSFSTVTYTTASAVSTIKFEADNFGFSVNGTSYPETSTTIVPGTGASTNTSGEPVETIPTTPPATPVVTGSTFINGPDSSSMLKAKEELKSKITGLQGAGLPGIKDIPKTLFEQTIKPKLLSTRQVAKKMLMMQGQSFNPPFYEEDAQLFIYGKVYYKNGVLFDNDNEDTACISLPDDDDYQPPIDENHPMWQKIVNMVKDLEESLTQLGIKLGEFMVALPAAIVTIAISLVSLVSSAVILPPGSGIPTALTSVQTMIKTIKQLQQKTAELLPLLVVIDTIGLLLPKSAQSVIAHVNVIFGLLLAIITGLTAILGLIGGVSSSVGKSTTKMQSIPLTIAPKADPSSVSQGQSTNLTANASGSDYKFTFEWTDSNGNVIARDPNDTSDDDGSRTVTPNITVVKLPAKTTYTCKVTDGKGTVKTSVITVTRI